MTTEFEFFNRFSPLADVLFLTTPVDFDNFERHTGLPEGTFRKVASSVRSHDYSFYNVNCDTNFLLNRTVPEFPSMPAAKQGKHDTPSGRGTTEERSSDTAEQGAKPNVSLKSQSRGSNSALAKQARRKHILDRICDRFFSSSSPSAAFLEWCSISPATLPWKRAVYDRLFKDEPIFVADLALSRSSVLSLCMLYASRYSTCNLCADVAARLALRIKSLERNSSHLWELSDEETKLFLDDNISDSKKSYLWAVGNTAAATSYSSWINSLVSGHQETE